MPLGRRETWNTSSPRLAPFPVIAVKALALCPLAATPWTAMASLPGP